MQLQFLLQHYNLNGESHHATEKDVIRNQILPRIFELKEITCERFIDFFHHHHHHTLSTIDKEIMTITQCII